MLVLGPYVGRQCGLRGNSCSSLVGKASPSYVFSCIHTPELGHVGAHLESRGEMVTARCVHHVVARRHPSKAQECASYLQDFRGSEGAVRRHITSGAKCRMRRNNRRI